MSLRRRLPSAFVLAALLALAGCDAMNTVSGYLGSQISFTTPQLQRHLNSSFPREFDKLGGLLSATLSNPQLTLPPGDDRLRLEFDIDVNALGAGEISKGHFALTSGLRYDAATRGLHLVNPEIIDVEVPGSGSLKESGTRELINAVLTEYAKQEPVYRIDADVLDRLPANKRIGATLIEDGRIVVKLDDR
jgi:predicted small secreted protein